MHPDGQAYSAIAPEYARLFPDVSFEALSDVAWLRRWAGLVGAGQVGAGAGGAGVENGDGPRDVADAPSGAENGDGGRDLADAPSGVENCDGRRDLADPPSSAGMVLDVGCGTGRLLPLLRECGLGHVMGVDPSEGMLDEARAAHPEGNWRLGEWARLPVANSSCAGVLSWYSAIHLTDRELVEAGAECARVLAPGGYALWAFHAGAVDSESRQRRADGSALVLRGLSVAHVARTLEAAGLVLLASGRREPRDGERHPQGFVLVRRRGGTLQVVSGGPDTMEA